MKATTQARHSGYSFFKCNELASRTSKDLNFFSFLVPWDKILTKIYRITHKKFLIKISPKKTFQKISPQKFLKHFVCHSIKSMFRVLSMYIFGDNIKTDLNQMNDNLNETSIRNALNTRALETNKMLNGTSHIESWSNAEN